MHVPFRFHLKILLLSQFFSSTKGGGEYVFEMIADGLAARGHEVWVITNRMCGKQYAYPDNLHVALVGRELEYAGGLPPSFADNIRYIMSCMFRGWRIISDNDIDIIHSNNFSPAVSGSILSVISGIRHIVTIFDIFSGDAGFLKRWARQHRVSRINALLVPLFEWMLPRMKCSAIFTLSEASRQDIASMKIAKPVHVIMPAIRDIPGMHVRPRRESTVRFVCVGRLVFYKNVDVIFGAVRQVARSYPDIVLTVIGDGPDRHRLEEMARLYGICDNVEFTGFADGDLKMRMLESSIAMLFPSTHEGFGLVILEAWQYGLPVIVSDVKPMSDIVRDGITGLVADPHDEDKWASCMMRIIEDTTASQEMGRAGMRQLQYQYGTNRFYDDVLRMYGAVASP